MHATLPCIDGAHLAQPPFQPLLLTCLVALGMSENGRAVVVIVVAAAASAAEVAVVAVATAAAVTAVAVAAVAVAAVAAAAVVAVLRLLEQQLKPLTHDCF